MRKIIHFFEANQSKCIFKHHTGYDCPGCGFQRAFIELLKGNFIESLIIYPALIPIIITSFLFFSNIFFKIKKGALILKYSFIATIAIIIISYLIKII
jgi:hypothetical protein